MISKALQHLSKDVVLKNLIQQIKLKERAAQPSVYEALLRAINFQQLSGKAATAIHNRFIDLFPNKYPDIALLEKIAPETLRSVGLSKQKISYVKNVANFFIQESLIDCNWEEKSDAEIIALLTQIKGVGNWTVEIILMFTLHRPDVLPLDDLVIKNAMIQLYKIEGKGKALNKKLTEIAAHWRPYRTLACQYLWQWRDTVL